MGTTYTPLVTAKSRYITYRLPILDSLDLLPVVNREKFIPTAAKSDKGT